MAKALVVAVACLVGVQAGCKGGSGAANEGAAAAAVDRSTPEALFASFREAVRRWDMPAMAACFGIPDASYEEFAAEFERDKAEIVECMKDAQLGATETRDDGAVRFGLINCPSKRGRLTATMKKQSDGSWIIEGM